MNNLANLLTGLSLACGFASLIFCLEGHFTFASWAILFSVVFDGVDGQVARRNPTPSEFGKELDSLVDVISFGLVPSVVGYVFLYRSFHLWATLALFLYLCCSVARLAKYNITPKGELKKYFYGLPTTVSGGVLASFILIFRKGGEADSLPFFAPVAFLGICTVLALLMISRIHYLNLEAVMLLLRRNKLLFFLTAGTLIVSFFLHKSGTVIFAYFVIYMLFSPFIAKKIV